jgi:hypothetical protein
MDFPHDCYCINFESKIYSLHKNGILLPYMHQNQHTLYIELSSNENEIGHRFTVQSLVAKYFELPEIEGKNLIWNKDENYYNNHIDNLQWVDKFELKKYRVEKLKKTLLKDELKDFKEINGHDGMYYINRQGKIFSFHIYGYRKPLLSPFGYYVMTIGIIKDKKCWSVHRLVATTFIPRISGKYFVNHKDGNKTNNDVNNLEWCTQSENSQHAHDIGLFPKTKPENNYHYYQIDENDEIIHTYMSIADIIRKFDDEVGYKELGKEFNEENGKKICGYYWKREKINYDIYDDEIWKPTNTGNDIDEFIEVSDYGRVRNIKTGHYYMQNDQGDYMTISINSGEKKKSYKVYHLVSQSFIENVYGTQDGIDVDHIDKNTKNNHVSNLQWLDKKAHAMKDKAISVTEVCEDGSVKNYDSLTNAGKAIGKNPGSISEAIKTGKPHMKSKWYRTSEYNK